MKIHSDTLTPTDILAAVPTGCYLAVFDHKDFGKTRVGVEGSRCRQRGFVVRLSGSNRYVMASLPDKAATWDEWGNFIDALYTLDPNAMIGHYGNRDEFIRQTTAEHERIRENRSDLLSTHTAPWISRN